MVCADNGESAYSSLSVQRARAYGTGKRELSTCPSSRREETRCPIKTLKCAATTTAIIFVNIVREKKRAPETHEQKTRRLERNKRYYESHKDEVKFRNALYRCDVPGYSHTGYPMTVLDAAYAALERALIQRRAWKRRQAP